MTPLIIAIVAPLLAAATLWAWVCRDSGTHNQPPFGEPRVTEDDPRRRP
jgi:hypothetical protein